MGKKIARAFSEKKKEGLCGNYWRHLQLVEGANPTPCTNISKTYRGPFG
jgi:hypothetical protein